MKAKEILEDMQKALEQDKDFVLDVMSIADIVVNECIIAIQEKIVRNGDTPENIRSRQHIADIKERFGRK